MIEMERNILLLRISYWAGALIDAFVGLAMISPDLFAVMEGFESFAPGFDYMFAMGMGAPLMFGWTLLLLWADRKPIERKDILLITVFPVIVGIYINRLIAISNQFVTIEGSLVSLVIPVILVFFLLTSYLYSARYPSEN